MDQVLIGLSICIHHHGPEAVTISIVNIYRTLRLTPVLRAISANWCLLALRAKRPATDKNAGCKTAMW